MDKLDHIFKLQKNFQRNILKNDIYSIQYSKDMALAAIIEISEAMQNIHWKPWQKNKIENNEKFKEELIDCLHFIINLCISRNINSTKLYYAFLKKNKENIKRQQNGY